VTIPAEIFRAYDIRGIVGRSLTAEGVRDIGRALGSVGRERGAATFAVCRDGRLSGPELADALMEGLVSAGANAIDIGMGPTPLAYFAAHHLGCGSCVAVSGSHNPPQYNGLKMVVGGDALFGDDIQDLRKRIEQGKFASGSGKKTKADVLDAYVERVAGDVKLARKFHVAIDCGNGVAGMLAPRLFKRLGCEVTELFCEVDGTFPNHHPDPTVPENLRDLQTEVRRSGAELGLAFDGDADRIGAVDETGTIVWGDQLLVILGRDAVRRFGPGTPVIFDVKCSELLPAALAEAGARPVMWKTGHSLIKAKMRELGAPLAGEMSGHMFFGGDYLGFDDALFAAARLLEIVSRQPFGLAALLADLPRTFTTPEIRVDVPEERKFEIVARAAEHFPALYPVNTIDGVRITFPRGWGLLRASNTQPILVLRFEATEPAALDAYRGEVTRWLAGQGVRA
jgi:phosphomannomutase/phosphoglucomutase